MDRCETSYDRQFARTLRWEQEMRKRTPEVDENKKKVPDFETQGNPGKCLK
jgi:hypothetical protein